MEQSSLLDDIAFGDHFDFLEPNDPGSRSTVASNIAKQGPLAGPAGSRSSAFTYGLDASTQRADFVQQVVQQERSRLQALLSASSDAARNRVDLAFENAAVAAAQNSSSYLVISGGAEAPQIMQRSYAVDAVANGSGASVAPPGGKQAALKEHLARRASIGMGFGTTQQPAHFSHFNDPRSQPVPSSFLDTSALSAVSVSHAQLPRSTDTSPVRGGALGMSQLAASSHQVVGSPTRVASARSVSPTMPSHSYGHVLADSLSMPVQKVVEAAVRAEKRRAGDMSATSVRGLCAAIAEYLAPALHAAVPGTDGPEREPPVHPPDVQVLGLQLGLSDTGIRAVKRLFGKIEAIAGSVARAHAGVRDRVRTSAGIGAGYRDASTELAHLSSKLAEALTSLREREATIASLRSEASLAREAASRLRVEVNAESLEIEAGRHAAASQRDSAAAMQGTLQAQVLDMQREVAVARESAASALARAAAAESRSEHDTLRWSQAQAQVGRLRDALVQAEEAREEAVAQRHTALADWERMSAETAALKVDVAAGHAALARLTAQLDRVGGRAVMADDAVDGLIVDRDELQVRCNALQAQVIAADMQLSTYLERGMGPGTLPSISSMLAEQHARLVHKHKEEVREAREALGRAQEDVARLRSAATGGVSIADLSSTRLGKSTTAFSPSPPSAPSSPGRAYMRAAENSWSTDLAAVSSELESAVRRAASAEETAGGLARQLQDARGRVSGLEAQLERVNTAMGGSAGGSGLGKNSWSGHGPFTMTSPVGFFMPPSPAPTGGSVSLSQLHEAMEQERKAAAAAIGYVNKGWEARQSELLAAAEAGRAAGAEQASAARLEAQKALTALAAGRDEAVAGLARAEAMLAESRGRILELEGALLGARTEAQACRDEAVRTQAGMEEYKADKESRGEEQSRHGRGAVLGYVAKADAVASERALQDKIDEMGASLRSVQAELSSAAREKAKLLEQLAAREEQKRRLELLLGEAVDTTEEAVDRAAVILGRPNGGGGGSLRAEAEAARADTARSQAEAKGLREQVRALQGALADASSANPLAPTSVVALLRQQLADTDSRLQSERDTASAKLRRLSTGHGASMDSLRAQHERHVSALVQQREAAVASVRAELEQALREKDVAAEKATGALAARVASLTSLLVELEAKCDAYEEGSGQVGRLQEAIVLKDETLARVQAQHARAASEAAGTVNAAKVRLQELESALSACRTSEVRARDELSAALQNAAVERQQLLAAQTAELDAASTASERASATLRQELSAALDRTMRQLRSAADSEVALLRESASKRESDLLAERESLGQALAVAKADASQAAVAAAEQLAAAQEAAAKAAADAAAQLADSRRAARDTSEASMRDVEETLRRVRESTSAKVTELTDRAARAEEQAGAASTAAALALGEIDRMRVETDRIRSDTDAIRSLARKEAVAAQHAAKAEIVAVREECAEEVRRARSEAKGEVEVYRAESDRLRVEVREEGERSKADAAKVRADAKAEVERTLVAASEAATAASRRHSDLENAVRAAEKAARACRVEVEAEAEKVARCMREMAAAKATHEAVVAELEEARAANEKLKGDVTDVRARLEQALRDAAELSESMRKESSAGAAALREAHEAEVREKNRELEHRGREMEDRERELKRRMDHAAASDREASLERERLSTAIKAHESTISRLKEQVESAVEARDKAVQDAQAAERHASSNMTSAKDEVEVSVRQLAAAKERERALLTRLAEERDRLTALEEECRRRVSAAEEDARRRVTAAEEDGRRRVSDVESTLSVLRERLGTANREADGARSEAKAASDSLSRAREELSALRRQSESDSRAIADATRAEVDRRASLMTASYESDARRLCEELAAAKSALSSQSAALKAEHAAELRAAHASSESAKARVAQLEAALSEVDRLRVMVDTLKGSGMEADRLKLELERVKDELAHIRAGAEVAQAEVHRLGAELRKASDEASRASSARTMVQEQLGDMQARAAALRAERDDMERRSESANELREQLTQARASCTRAEEALRSIKAEHAGEVRALEERAARVAEEFRMQAKALEERASGEVGRVAAALRVTQAEADGLRSQAEGTRAQAAAAASRFAEEMTAARGAHEAEVARVRQAQELAVSQLLESAGRPPPAPAPAPTPVPARGAQGIDAADLMTPARFFAARGRSRIPSETASHDAVDGPMNSNATYSGAGGDEEMDELRRRATRILLEEADAIVSNATDSSSSFLRGAGIAQAASSAFHSSMMGRGGDAQAMARGTDALSVILGARVVAAAQRESEAAAIAAETRERAWREVNSHLSHGPPVRVRTPPVSRVGVPHSEVAGVSHSSPTQAQGGQALQQLYGASHHGSHPHVRPAVEEGIDMTYMPAAVSPPSPAHASSMHGHRPGSPYYLSLEPPVQVWAQSDREREGRRSRSSPVPRTQTNTQRRANNASISNDQVYVHGRYREPHGTGDSGVVLSPPQPNSGMATLVAADVSSLPAPALISPTPVYRQSVDGSYASAGPVVGLRVQQTQRQGQAQAASPPRRMSMADLSRTSYGSMQTGSVVNAHVVMVGGEGRSPPMYVVREQAASASGTLGSSASSSMMSSLAQTKRAVSAAADAAASARARVTASGRHSPGQAVGGSDMYY